MCVDETYVDEFLEAKLLVQSKKCVYFWKILLNFFSSNMWEYLLSLHSQRNPIVKLL